MPKFLSRFYLFINQQWAILRFVLLAVAIIVQCIYDFHSGPTISHDAGYQLGAVHQVLAGHGVSTAIATDSEQLAQIDYQTVTQWPFGYTLLITPFQALLGDLWWSAMLVQWLNVLIFFSAWFVITETLSDFFSIPVRLMLWLYWIVIYNPVLSSTDGLALALFSASFALIIVSLKRQTNLLTWMLLSGLIMAATMTLRYAYWPLVVVIPGSLFFYALLSKRYQRIGMAVIQGAVSSIGCVAAVLYNYFTADLLVRGALGVEAEQQSGLLWNNLHSFVPFPAEALGMVSNLRYIGHFFNLPEMWISAGLWLIALIFVLGLCVMLWTTYQKKQADNLYPVWVIFASGILLSVVLTGFLIYLSLTSVKWWGWWTYVGETRYFQPVFPFLALALFTLALQREKSCFAIVRRLVTAAIIVAVVAGLAVRVPNLRWMIRTWTFASSMDRTANMVIYSTLREIGADQQPIIFVRGNLYDSGRWDAEAALAGAVIYRGTLTAATDFSTDNPITLLVGIPHDGVPEQVERLTQLVEQHNGTQVAEIPDFLRLYVVHLE